MAAALAPLIANLVHQQSTTTGTGNFTLSAVNGKQSFNTAFGNGATTDVFPYFISNQSAAEYERGTGHMSDATTLVRDTVSESTNANAAVNFSAGTKDVVCDVPATRQWYAQEVSLASAGTTDLGTYPSASVTVTGTTTITSFGSTATTGAIRFIEFSGALTLTHNATSLIIPGGANITTAAGDCAIVRHEGSGNWRVLHYQKATGTAIVATDATLSTSDITTNDVSTSKHGFVPKAPNDTTKFLCGDASWTVIPFGAVQIATASPTGVATSAFTNIPATYSYLIIAYSGISCDTATRHPRFFVSQNNGSSYDTTTSNYPASSAAGLATSATTQSAAQTAQGYISIFGYQGNSNPIVNAQSANAGSALTTTLSPGFYIGSASAINAIRMDWNGSGNFDAGTWTLYGVK